MPISAKIIADSISPGGVRLTTMQVTMHRFVLAEFNTHRVFSRNSASSRAIPIEKRIAAVMEDPAMPVEWGRNQKGMQAGGELDLGSIVLCKERWLEARDAAVNQASELLRLGLHKQVANRLLEPFLWHTVVVTSTEWENFFNQRCSPLAQPEIRLAAEAMREALNNSPVVMETPYGYWHLPYIDELADREEPEYITMMDRLKMCAVARCARVSYLTQEGTRDLNKDIELYNRLATADPPHMSPFEHVATPARDGEITRGNFRGWHQLRHMVFDR